VGAAKEYPIANKKFRIKKWISAFAGMAFGDWHVPSNPSKGRTYRGRTFSASLPAMMGTEDERQKTEGGGGEGDFLIDSSASLGMTERALGMTPHQITPH